MDTETNLKDTNKEQLMIFIQNSQGLSATCDEKNLKILQSIDKKTLCINIENIDGILTRYDEKGDCFLQVNFKENMKILITDHLIGFKPARPINTQKMNIELPNVVTTPDLMSVIEAIETCLFATDSSEQEVEALKTLFQSVLDGAEKVGFELKKERLWLRGLNFSQPRGAA